MGERRTEWHWEKHVKLVAVIKTAIGIFFHLVAILILGAAVWPIASWYFDFRPILGVDFFNTVTHVRMFAENFNFPPWAYRSFWFGGSPLYPDFSIGWYYPISILARWLPLIASVKVGMLVSLFLFLVFTYLTAQRLSRNHLFAVVIAVLVAFSPNLYGSLTWGGSLPYFANQLFFPLSLWTLSSYLETGRRGWFWGTVFVVGLAFLGHAMNAGTFVLVSAAILLFLGWRKQPLGFKGRLGEFAVFLVGLMILSNRVTTSLFSGLFIASLKGRLLTSFGAASSGAQFREGGLAGMKDSAQAAWEQSRFLVLFSDTNPWIFAIIGFAVAVFLVALVMDKEKKQVLRIAPWAILAGYSILHVFANSYGFPFLSQGWYRAFWHFPVSLGLLLAVIVGYILDTFSRITRTFGKIASVALGVLSVGMLGVVYQSVDLAKTLAVVTEKSSPSSAYPEAINLIRSDEDLTRLQKDLVPAWLDPFDRNWRLYETDAQVNVWWNALFDMPLVRGYIDPPIGTDRMGQIFLTDQALGADGLVENFHYPVDTAKNMALYYIDWNAVRYFEGGHVSISDNKRPSSFLEGAIAEQAQTKTVGLYRLYETPSGKPEIMDIPQYLEYFRVKDELVSPVVSVSNAPSLLCLCDWPAYEALIKALSMNNIHSRFLITAYSEKPVDSFSTSDLSSFDVVYLANYRYRNRDKAFSSLSRYVSAGGKVLIDTGSETRESARLNLPELFPFLDAQRQGLGSQWEITASSDPVFSGVDFEAFSPPTWEDGEWKFSYPVSEVDAKAEVLLFQRGKPVLVRYPLGEGTVLWSGMNLAYHVHANTNVMESRLLVNLLDELVPLNLTDISTGAPRFESPRSVSFRSD